MADHNHDRPRRVSFAAHEEEEAGEGTPLLQDAEPAIDESPNVNLPAHLPIYTTIHR
jgi:hypothetical protein